jgi:hypothetical protein
MAQKQLKLDVTASEQTLNIKSANSLTVQFFLNSDAVYNFSTKSGEVAASGDEMIAIANGTMWTFVLTPEESQNFTMYIATASGTGTIYVWVSGSQNINTLTFS